MTVLHKENTRGKANHGWLNAAHSFSFANYHNPSRMNFGALRVLNDDIVAAGMGFGRHPHDNMEIVTIPLSGELAHKDSMGNGEVIRSGDIQVMSAGTGITHSEVNASKEHEVRLLQIWVIPNKRNVAPRYEQISLNPEDRHNKLQQIVSPNPDDAGVWVHQNAWFHLGRFDKNFATEYNLKGTGTGVYAFVINGDFIIDGQKLNKRDAIGITETDKINIEAENDGAEILLIEVPM